MAYDTVSFEPIINVYQTLVAYNGSSSAQFVPELSLCVPGPSDGSSSAPGLSCQAKFGTQLVTYNSLGQPLTFTYPIDPAARYYDPATGVSWPVYPSDVMFSLARTQAFADLPGVAIQNGWIQTQALAQYGSSSWDGAIHSPWNNTPQGALGSMLINDSTYCPASVLAVSNGCITFVAQGSSTVWPFFNQLIADPLGGGVVPCGWYTAQGAGVPGFTGSSVAKGDGPCLLPGGAYNTSSSAFQNWMKTTPPTYWDSFEELTYNHPAIQPGVQWSLVGSGPYYIAPGALQATVGYTLQASPAYHQPTGCVGFGGGCQPAVGAYIPKVVVTYEATDTEGIQEYVAGQSDMSYFLPPETSTMLQLKSQGKVHFTYAPDISVFFDPYNFAWNTTTEPSIDPIATINVPSDFFASNTVRNLINHAWPYTTILNTLWTVDGISYYINTGGAIPKGMGNYFPSNITWPYLGGDPDSNTSVNSAAWWWHEGITPGTPYYDPELAKCTTSTPCRFPLIGEVEAAALLDPAFQDLITSVSTITGGAIQMYTFDISFHDLVVNSLAASYDNPMPFYTLGWAPDYPDPTDYLAAMYYPNGSYTLGDTIDQVLENAVKYPQYWTNTTCTAHNTNTFADLAWFASLYQYGVAGANPLPNGCQGPAYAQMIYWMDQAAALPVGSYRILLYNLIEHIENQLGLYIWMQQQNGIYTTASWINGATINTNVMIGGGNDQTYFLWGYSNQVSTVYINETGLPTGTSWSVNFAGTSHTTTATGFTLTSVTAGTYPWSVDYKAGYSVANATGLSNGTVVVKPPTSVAVTVTFATTTDTDILNIQEIGLTSGLNWTALVPGYGAIVSNDTVHSYTTLPASLLTYYIAYTVGYVAYPNTGTATPSASPGTTVTTTFTGLLFRTFYVEFSPQGLGGGAWTITLGKFPNSSATGGSIYYWEPNGTYPFTLSGPSGLTPISTKGIETVAGANQTTIVPFTASPKVATFFATFSPLIAKQFPTWAVTATTYSGSDATGYNFTVASTGASLAFNLAGTVGTVYNYTVYPIAGWSAVPTAGSISVNPATGLFNNTTIVFSLVTYPVTVFEVGLPALIAGHPPNWGVNASFTYPGTTVTGYVPASTGGSGATALTILLPNGTSGISFIGPAGWVASPTSVLVAAAPTAAVGVFAPVPFTYQVTFTQTGLSGTWTIYFNGAYKSGTGALTFAATNGTYTYAVVVPSGQQASPSGGTLIVNGTAKAVSVSVSSVSTSPSVPSWAWAVIGVFVVLTLIFLITTLMARRRPKTPPPQTWQPGQGQGGEGGTSPPPPST